MQIHLDICLGMIEMELRVGMGAWGAPLIITDHANSRPKPRLISEQPTPVVAQSPSVATG